MSQVNIKTHAVQIFKDCGMEEVTSKLRELWLLWNNGGKWELQRGIIVVLLITMKSKQAKL